MPAKISGPRKSTRLPEIPDPPAEGGGSGEGWKLLTTAKDIYTASILEGFLVNRSIEVFLDTRNPSLGAFLKPFGDPLAPVGVYVKSVDIAHASLLLHEVDHRPYDHNASPPRMVARLWWLTILFVLVAAMLAVIEIFDFAPCVVGAFCL